MSRDKVYEKQKDMLVDFAFDESVARVFPDMIRRSVPGYETIISMIGLLVADYAQPGSRCYDLGCSLGASTLSVLRRMHSDDVNIIAVDNAEAMVERCRNNIKNESTNINVDVICADVLDVPIEDASVVILNFTLQFIPVPKRLALLRRIYQGLRPGGALLLSEKIMFMNTEKQSTFDTLHAAFKKANGYSELEISQKRAALDNILIPETIEQHQQRLHEAGFSESHVWFQCLNFVSLLAIK